MSQGGVLLFDRKLKPRGAIRFDGAVDYPTSLAVRGNRLAVADAVGRQILFYRHDRKVIKAAGKTSTGQVEPRGVEWLGDKELVVSDPFKRSLSVYRTNGSRGGTFDANVVGSFRSPGDLDLRNRQIYTADRDRIVILPAKPGLASWAPVITFGNAGEATLTWDSAVPTKTEVRYWPEQGAVQVVAAQGLSKDHQLILADLPPVSRIN